MQDNSKYAALAFYLADTALGAGAIIMRHYRHGENHRYKADGSPVTLADHEAEAFIVRKIRRVAPHIPVLSEELVAAGRIPPLRRRFFCVDPLDGTREFVDRYDGFTVNIALVDSGEPVIGVVGVPAQRRIFFSWGRHHAFEQRGQTRWTARRLTTRRRSGAPVLTVSRSHRQRGLEEVKNTYRTDKVIAIGSALKFALLAAGEADLYPREGPTMLWDTAAGHAVLAAAGGRVEKLDDHTPLRYGPFDASAVLTSDRLVNPPFLAAAR